jgi:putative hydrolase of the HAD superfamily
MRGIWNDAFMPLLLLDLDNTLIDRDGAFLDWAETFVADHGLPRTALAWLTAIDGGGYVPRETVLGAARRRYRLDVPLTRLRDDYQTAMVKHARCPSSHVEALLAARRAGWTLGIVSNGDAEHQLAKIFGTGLDGLVDGWVVSGEVGHAKPDPELFRIAARRCGVPPRGTWAARTWMIGDHAPADIAGAEVTGLRSVWLRHGRPWAERHYRPTAVADSLPEAVALALAAETDQPAAGPVPADAPSGEQPRQATAAVPPPGRPGADNRVQAQAQFPADA